MCINLSSYLWLHYYNLLLLYYEFEFEYMLIFAFLFRGFF